MLNAIPKSLNAAEFMNPGSFTNAAGFKVMDFELPRDLEATEPPEARGLARDEVRLMVSYRHDDCIKHTTFRDLPRFLDAGDLLVVNTSGTMNAAIKVMRSDGT